MITLTYPKQFPCDGRIVKSHLNRLLSWLRYHHPGVAYLWFLEFQKRGAPHVHIITNIPITGCRDRRAAMRRKLARAWFRIVESGDPKHLVAGTAWDAQKKPNGLRHYVAIYASKKQQKTVPPDYQNVGRFWGKSRNVTCSFTSALALDETELRQRLKTWGHLPPEDRPIYKVLYNAADHLDTKRD